MINIHVGGNKMAVLTLILIVCVAAGLFMMLFYSGPRPAEQLAHDASIVDKENRRIERIVLSGEFLTGAPTDLFMPKLFLYPPTLDDELMDWAEPRRPYSVSYQ